MNIQGLQKMTLLDYPGKIACTVFLGSCNFRCPFCHNAALVREADVSVPALSEADVLTFLKKRQGLLDGVCITGGEPLMQADLAPFLKKIKDLGYDIKLDTNGSFPDRLAALMDAGLVDYVAMDVKNALPWYGATIGLPNYDTTAVEKSVACLLQGDIPYEFRTTVVHPFHNLERLERIATWIKGAPHYFLQTFVDSGDLLGEGCSGFDETEMNALAEALGPWVHVRGT